MLLTEGRSGRRLMTGRDVVLREYSQHTYFPGDFGLCFLASRQTYVYIRTYLSCAAQCVYVHNYVYAIVCRRTM